MRKKQDVICSRVSDFTIGDYTFEIGGRKKGKKQIEDVKNGAAGGIFQMLPAAFRSRCGNGNHTTTSYNLLSPITTSCKPGCLFLLKQKLSI